MVGMDASEPRASCSFQEHMCEALSERMRAPGGVLVLRPASARRLLSGLCSKILSLPPQRRGRGKDRL